jgi:hypothetical protein
MPAIPDLTLNNGVEIPAISLETFGREIPEA